ncbi:MAG: hypothetical protein U9M90_03075 [Patescibacteria group bacterium]|nr:hypothetical protein [Patescibacteria group bacterium]
MKQTTVFNINTVIATAIGAFIFVWVSFGVLSSKFHYMLNSSDAYGIVLNADHIDKNDVIYVAPLFDYKFSSIHLEIKTNNEFTDVPKKIDVYKGHISLLYPEGEAITTEENLKTYLWNENIGSLANGRLVSYNEAVYMISNGKRRAFLAPEIFERLGYNWNAVEEIDGDVINKYEKGEKIGFGSSHPDGTILNIKETLFFTAKGEKHKIDSALINEVTSHVSPVFISDNELTFVGECELSKKMDQSIHCELVPHNAILSQGHDYIFFISQEVMQDISEASIVFNASCWMDGQVALASLGRIKQALRNRYFPDLIQ